MGLISSVLLYIRRKPGQTILFALLLGIIVFGECIGLLLYGTSVQAEQDAFIYNGAALSIYSESISFTQEDYEQIRQLDYVEGVSNSLELIVTPQDSQNVKDHTGVDPVTQETNEDSSVQDTVGTDGTSAENSDQAESAYGWSTDDMVIVAEMDVALDELFRWQECVSLVDGEYSDYENKGILIESRYAGANNLSVGDFVSFYSDEYDCEVSLVICGIYEVDSDFEILEGNTYGTGIYIFSPYNHIYMEYYAAQEAFGFDAEAVSYGAGVFIDGVEHLEAVADELYTLYGNDLEVYDMTSGYLDDEGQVVTLMKRMSFLICIMVFVLGFLIILLVFSLFSGQYQEETGRFLVLGENRRWCVGRFVGITFCYVFLGALLGMAVYLISRFAIAGVIEELCTKTISESVYYYSEKYNVTNLQQYFTLRVSGNILFEGRYLLMLAGGLLVGWLITLLLPLHSALKSRPRKLLQSKNA